MPAEWTLAVPTRADVVAPNPADLADTPDPIAPGSDVMEAARTEAARRLRTALDGRHAGFIATYEGGARAILDELAKLSDDGEEYQHLLGDLLASAYRFTVYGRYMETDIDVWATRRHDEIANMKATANSVALALPRDLGNRGDSTGGASAVGVVLVSGI